VLLMPTNLPAIGHVADSNRRPKWEALGAVPTGRKPFAWGRASHEAHPYVGGRRGGDRREVGVLGRPELSDHGESRLHDDRLGPQAARRAREPAGAERRAAGEDRSGGGPSPVGRDRLELPVGLPNTGEVSPEPGLGFDDRRRRPRALPRARTCPGSWTTAATCSAGSTATLGCAPGWCRPPARA